MILKEIPKVRYAVIGGSGTWAGEYPENTGIEGIRILQRDMEFETPFGTTVSMKLFELDGSLTADGYNDGERQFVKPQRTTVFGCLNGGLS